MLAITNNKIKLKKQSENKCFKGTLYYISKQIVFVAI